MERIGNTGFPPASGGKCRGRHVLMRHLHETRPDLDRKVAAGCLFGRRTVVIAEPDHSYEMARITDEPSVPPILAGAGFAGRLPAWKLALAGGTGQQCFLHHRVHHRDILRFDEAAIARSPALVEEFASGVTHFGDDMGLDTDSAVCEWHIGGHEFERRYLGRAQSDRGIGLKIRIDAEAMRDPLHSRGADLEAEPHGHCIQ